MSKKLININPTLPE